MKQHYDFLLFDLDGTISDPIEGIGRSINYALEHYGYAPLLRDAQSPWIGPPLFHSFRAYTGRDDEAHLHELVAKYRERYADVGYAENTIYPGIAEALQALADTGVPMAVCTSKRADFAQRILELFGIARHFSFVDGGDIHIEKWEQMAKLRERGIVTEHALMIGDREFDMLAAHRNGLSAAGVLWGYGSREELAAHAPAHLLAATAELHALVPLCEGSRS
ncbi:HAD hydrolase-like protein [Uliginosibacterium sp. H3]|uniref:HAD hydrolase-like protein n=1 Tax=Uliginosibacterium silvisoli TaxID=3114758 RepID=A0ABU6JZU5_9RHOO|nr:HAD hydrolase-like protein [Uliginosibacterium sp. H3]